MTDLGPEEVPAHEQLGRDAAGAGLAGLIVVGDAAAPILAGAKSHPSWRGELLGVADTRAAIQAMRDRLRPGDVVLVKASRVAAIEGIALALAGEKGHPVKTILVSSGVALLLALSARRWPSSSSSGAATAS